MMSNCMFSHMNRSIFWNESKERLGLKRYFTSRSQSRIHKGKVSKTLPVPPHIKRPPYASNWSDNSLYFMDHRPEIFRTPEEIKRMKRASQIGREIMEAARKLIKPGITTDELDMKLHQLIVQKEAYPSPLLYKGFPKSICTSVNDVVIHGIPDNRPLEPTDIVTVDITVYHDGHHGDLAETFLVSDSVDDEAKKLVQCAREALEVGISVVGPGVALSKIGEAISDYAERKGYAVCREFGGHGIGQKFHNFPIVRFDSEDLLDRWRLTPTEGNNVKIPMEPGMTFTIEPALMENKNYKRLKMWEDGWTVSTEDYSWSAQFEQTVMVTENGVDVLTR